MRFNFDMDGTIANLYAVEGWLQMLQAENPKPYAIAKPLVNMARLAKALNKATRNGHEIVVISWGAKNGSAEYLNEVTAAKLGWLKHHLPSVKWTKILVVPYGTPKHSVTNGILFDDEERNLTQWGEGAFPPSEIFAQLATA